jgi:plasmid stabilization system protein ParE
VSRIRTGVQHLRLYPESGRIIPELPTGRYREVIVGQYRAIYRYDRVKDAIVIVSIIHGRQNLPNLDDD